MNEKNQIRWCRDIITRTLCKLTLSDMRSESSWHNRQRKEFGSRVRVVLAVRKYVPPTFSLTHWLLLHLLGRWLFLVTWWREFVSHTSAMFAFDDKAKPTNWKASQESPPPPLDSCLCLCVCLQQNRSRLALRAPTPSLYASGCRQTNLLQLLLPSELTAAGVDIWKKKNHILKLIVGETLQPRDAWRDLP